MELTTTQVSRFAALIALAAPAITYRASIRLDRDRWVRERRAETYIDALAVLGRIAAHVTEPDKRRDPFEPFPVTSGASSRPGSRPSPPPRSCPCATRC